MRVLFFGLLLSFSLACGAAAHETTRSYLTLNRDGADLQVDLRIAFRDIEVAVWIDEDLDGTITWGEVGRRVDAVSGYALSALTFETVSPCRMARTDVGTSMNGGIAYLDLSFRGKCADPLLPLRVTSRLFAEFDPDHRLFLTANIAGAATTSLLSAAESSIALTALDSGSSGSFLRYFREGIRHLLGGADHLVFLMVLVLPAAASRTNARRAALGVVTAVTSFTVAHALTLTAAATSLLRPPTALIETLIALSIVIAAIDNLRPFIPAPRAAVAGFFGLIHGFGFATALGALNLSGIGFVTSLIGFNFGIEVAQIAFVLVLLPALSFLRQGRAVMWIGSLGAIAIGMFWVWQRAAL